MRRTVYLVMLIESKGALQRLVKMATVSPWICEELTHYPVLLDEFLSMDFELPKRKDLEDSLRQQLYGLRLIRSKTRCGFCACLKIQCTCCSRQ